MTPRRPALLVLVSAWTAAGCGSSDGGSGGPPAECEPVQSRSLAWSERSPLGFSADELLGTLGSPRETRLRQSDGTSTALSLAITRASGGSLSFQTRERQSASLEPEACADAMSLPVTLSFATNDGAFDETWTLELLAEGAGHATGHADVDLLTLEGSYTVTEVDPEAFDEIVGLLDIDLDASTWSGKLSGRGDSESGGSGQRFEIGTFR